MDVLDLFLDLPLPAQFCSLLFVACSSGLLLILLIAPRQDYFFLRWRPEVRLLTLIVAPALLIVWPLVLYAWS